MKYLILKHALKNAWEHDGEARVKPIMNKVIGENPELKEDMGKLGKKTNEVVQEVNQMTKKQQERKLLEINPEALEKEEKEEKGLTELPGDTSKVITRFAPFPSGPLHLGHCKQAIPNYKYAERYNGKFYLVIDDTIGSTNKEIDSKAYDMIKEDMEWLGLESDEVILKSDRIEKYYEWAERIMDTGKAYVCKCPVERLRKNREKGKECEHRSNTVEENKEEFQRMLNKEYGEGEAVLRLKTDMQHKDPAFRDRVLLRISEREHPKVGEKYTVWPMLEFSWAVDDYLLGMTHIIRGKDLVMETKMEKYIWDCLDLDYSEKEFIHTGRMNLKEVKMSSSEAARKIKEGEYKGWSDPRTWSVRSLKKRGIKPEAITNFIISQGISESSSTVPLNKLYAENRKIIDPEARRFYYIPNPVKVKVKNIPEMEVEVSMHPEKDLGKKKHKFESGEKIFYLPKEDLKDKNQGDKIRLKGAFSIEVTGKNGEFIESEFSSTELKDDVTDIIQWVTGDHKTVEITHDNGEVERGYGEKHLEKVEKGEVIQFERYGFVCVNEKGKNKIKVNYTHK
ncbi:MAG: glutamate--tRNA ligase [archaeon]